MWLSLLLGNVYDYGADAAAADDDDDDGGGGGYDQYNGKAR